MSRQSKPHKFLLKPERSYQDAHLRSMLKVFGDMSADEAGTSCN